MIKGQEKTEKEYRKMDLDSYSSLKEFALDRRAYFKKYILGEKKKDEDNVSTLLGKLVETLLFENEKFDSYFHISSVEPPTAMMLDFVNALLEYTFLSVDPDTGELDRNFEEILRLAYDKSGYKIPFERVIKSFSGTDNELYYLETKNVMQKNLSVVGINQVSVAETIASNLKINEFVSDIINQQTDKDHVVYHQLKVNGYEVDGHKLKSMLDKVIFHIPTKKAYVYDLKVTWAVDTFYETYYLKRLAYIQGFLYKKALEHVIATTPQLKGFTVENTIFIVCDSNGFNGPVLYKTTNKALHDAYIGFEHRGREYAGVKDIIKDLKWAVNNSMWEYSRNTYTNRGILKIGD